MAKQKILSLTKKDFRIDFYRGTGTGGQKKNKTSSACRITHIATGISANCENSRSQAQNKWEAWRKLTTNPEFVKWLHLQAAMAEGGIDRAVDEAMRPKNIKIEYYEPTGVEGNTGSG